MSRIIVEYNPDLSGEAKELIRNNITPSMSSNDGDSHDGDSHQYNIDFVLADLFRELPVEDKIIIQALSADNVEYLEF
jgi:hypothetical protein